MPKKPDERIGTAKKMYLEGKKLIDIAKELDLPEGTVRRWKSTHHWDSERSDKNIANVRIKRKRGGQPGNHNATGPPKNQNARKHGFYSRWLPSEIKEIIDDMPTDPLDILWSNIELQYAKIIHAQKIIYVNDRNDKTTDISFEGDNGTGYAIQQAWDKENKNIQAQSRAMQTLLSMIKEYDDMLHKNWDTATELQKAKLVQIKVQTDKLKGTTADDMDGVVIVDDIEEN